MGVKKILLALLLLFSFLFAVDCVVPYNDMVLRGHVTLCPGTYLVPDVVPDPDHSWERLIGVFIINESDVHLDCNGAILMGENLTNDSMGFPEVNHGIAIAVNSWTGNRIKNITIENCDLRYYGGAIAVRDHPGFFGTSPSGERDGYWTCSSIKNNNAEYRDCLSKYADTVKDLVIRGNNISKCSNGISLECVSNAGIAENYIHDLIINPIELRNSYNISISKNHILIGPQWQADEGFGLIGISRNSDYISITGNTLEPGLIYGWVSHAYIANNRILALDGKSGIRLGDYNCGRDPGKIIIFGNMLKLAQTGMILNAIENDKIAETNFFEYVTKDVTAIDPENVRSIYSEVCYR